MAARFSCNSLLSLAVLLATAALAAQSTDPATDSDHDGLTDALEQKLLLQFAPRFMLAEHDCSTLPAEFTPEHPTPKVLAENGTLYGQVFPVMSLPGQPATAEIHFYHLWRTDCGSHGHPLDTEHVAVLVQAPNPDPDLATAKWKALYWYAAAHENTVCDVSQITRASTLHAEDHGATVWVSAGKHASYLNETLCQRGCGADRCVNMVPLQSPAIINLGEPGHPMNGAVFATSKAWPLLAKMSASNFPAAPIDRLSQLPATDIAWFNPGRHPAQGIIAHSNSTGKAIAIGGRSGAEAISQAGDSTGSALNTANDSTGVAISLAEDSTGNALQKSYRHTRHALASSIHHIGDALSPTPKTPPPTPSSRAPR
jgi:hypothetical protein